MPYSIDDPLSKLIRSGRNNGVRSALSTVETPPTATAGDQDAPTAANHILADIRPKRAPAFAARFGFCVSKYLVFLSIDIDTYHYHGCQGSS